MMLTAAKKRAPAEFAEALARAGLTVERYEPISTPIRT